MPTTSQFHVGAGNTARDSPLSASAAQWLHITDLGGQVKRRKQTAATLWGFQRLSLRGGEGQCMNKLQIPVLNNVGENTISTVVSVRSSWRRCHLTEALNNRWELGGRGPEILGGENGTGKTQPPGGSVGCGTLQTSKRGKLCRSYWMFFLRPHAFLASLRLPQWG